MDTLKLIANVSQTKYIFCIKKKMRFTSLDNFAPKQNEPHSKTCLGAFLTAVAPLIIAGYCYLTYLAILSQPPKISTATTAAGKNIFHGTFRCMQEKCLVSSSYAENSVCYNELSASNDQFLNKCSELSRNVDTIIKFCYTPDPIDGLSILWKRNGTNSRTGVTLKQEFFDQKEKKWLNTDINLFFGTHLFSVNQITETISNDAHQVTIGPEQVIGQQVSTVHVSSDSMIDDTNLCCKPSLDFKLLANSVCASDGDPGNVNDHWEDSNLGVGFYVPGRYYIARFRTFPTFDSMNITTPARLEILTSLLNSAGSIWSILGTGFGFLVAFYRFCSGTSRLKELDNSRGGSIQGSAEMV